MTTTTLTLFRIQARVLAIPLLVLVACLLVSFIQSDVLRVTAAVLSIFAAIVSGPVLFGVEFADGQRDYLNTRPISRQSVLRLKVGFLLAISIVAGIVFENTVPFFLAMWPWGNFEHLTPVTIALFFDLCLWLSISTLLFRDTIRGLLYGAPAITSVVALGWLIPWPFYQVDISLLNKDMTINGFGPKYTLDENLILVGFILSPLVFLALLGVVSESLRKGKLSAPVYSMVFPLIVASYFVWAGSALQPDGKASVYSSPNSIIGYDVEHDLIFTLPNEYQNGKMKTATEINLIESRDIHVPEAPIASASTDPYRVDRVIPHHNEMILIATKAIGFMDRDYPLESAAVEIAWVTIDGIGLWCHGFYRKEHLLLSAIACPDENEKSGFYDLDIRTKELTFLFRQAENFFPTRVVTGDRKYTISKDSLGVRVTHAEDIGMGDQTLPSNFHHPTVEGNFAVEFTSWQHSEIHLCDTSDLEFLDYRTLAVPPEGIDMHRSIEHWLGILGIERQREPNQSRPLPSITLGSGFLAYWEREYSRVAVWDVHDFDRPVFLGTAPTIWENFLRPTDFGTMYYTINSAVPPLRREDGALGFVGTDHILWLEFPALMKEGDRS